jgi:hypothetical protein
MPSLADKKPVKQAGKVITAKDFGGKCKTEAARHERRFMCVKRRQCARPPPGGLANSHPDHDDLEKQAHKVDE